MKKTLYNIASGNPKALVLPSVLSLIEGIAKILPFALLLDIINVIYTSFAEQAVIDMQRLWISAGLMLVWLIALYFISAITYDKTYLAAYNSSAEGRISLAEKLRKLSLGFFNSRDPGDLTTMTLGDYAAVEKVISRIPIKYS